MGKVEWFSFISHVSLEIDNNSISPHGKWSCREVKWHIEVDAIKTVLRAAQGLGSLFASIVICLLGGSPR